ncbi:Druantia anti-phage system protein DruA [Methyloprofundus sp.]|uniref:Druantia anti-phage system protein DruA n=1 Tax=Methyloprofundus sp. TaxID=2020875 RepID=UPI003D119034
MTRYCGRNFSEQELEQMRKLIAEDAGRTRAELSRLTCRMLDWYKPDGGLKDMSCRVAMLRMAEDGLIALPPPRRKPPPRQKLNFTEQTDPQPAILRPVHELAAIQLCPVITRDHSRLWNEYIHRYHYLGHKPLPGAQLRYFVILDEQIIAALGFSAAAWQTAPRDQFIGWSHEQRQRNLPLVVNNARFLIMPWVKSKNLASTILSMIARRLPTQWEERYGIRPVLLETFVDTERFAGTCYKAANWIYVGKTKGRGKLGPAGKQSVPIKDLWLYPLCRQFRSHLTR